MWRSTLHRIWETGATFMFRPPTIIFGPGTVKRVGQRAKEYGARRVGVVADANVVKAGHLSRVLDSLSAVDIEADVFDRVEGEPTVDTVQAGVDHFRSRRPDVLIGLGGGSAIDANKAINRVLADGGEPADYIYGRRQAVSPGVPYISIPTTAGTAAEVSMGAVIGDQAGQVKENFAMPPWVVATAICDPELTLTVPPFVTAYCGMDALGHAIDSYMNINFNPICDAIDLQVMQLVAQWLPVAVAKGSDLTARSNVMFAASSAGLGFSQRGTALTHGISHPLGVYGRLPHGLTISLLLPFVMEYNLDACAPKLADVAAAMGQRTEGLTLREAALKAVEAVRTLSRAVGLPQRLRDAGVAEADLPTIAQDTATRRRNNILINPRDATAEQIERLLRDAY